MKTCLPDLRLWLSTCVALAAFTSSANAHFIWLSPQISSNAASKVSVYFGEEADDDNSDYLSRVKGVQVYQVIGNQPASEITLNATDTAIWSPVSLNGPQVYVASHDLGVMDRGDSRFRLLYYAKTGPEVSSPAWSTAKTADDLKLDIVPQKLDGQVLLTVHFCEKPAVNVEVKVARPGADDVTLTTDDKGQATFETADPGLYSVRAKLVEPARGERNGQSFTETRHYCTVSLMVADADTAAVVPASDLTQSVTLQDLPQPVTSFGAAVDADRLFMYGGHTGGAHSYSMEEQSNELTMLDFKTGQWKTLADGPHLQGLALVAHDGKLYRIGGFTALNAEGEDHDLMSQDTVACFDPELGAWQEMPALPERRSSFDAAVLENSIYVIGGWKMGGVDDNQWHTTAWKLDLTKHPMHWQPIAAPPFQRRALAVAAFDGKLFAVGGMQETGGPTTAVGIYDPASDTWSDGPKLFANPAKKDENGKPIRSMTAGPMVGFGASAFAAGEYLYCSTVQGHLQRLGKNGTEWEVVRDDLSPRFFHRLLAVSDDQLVVVGGSNMSIGKFEEVEMIDLNDRIQDELNSSRERAGSVSPE